MTLISNKAAKVKPRKNNGPTITFGADPEFFALNKAGTLIPSWELGVTGEKGHPEIIPGAVPGTGILCDGVTLEINVAPRESLVNVAGVVVNGMNSFITSKKEAVEKKAIVGWNVDFIEVPRKYHAHPFYTTCGCSSDMDAYLEAGIRKPFLAEDFGTHRFAGGHIHIGADPWPEWLPKRAFVQFLDTIYFSTVNGLRAGPRTKFYGVPGLWRETPYGVEYRTPNTTWLQWRSGLERVEGQILDVLQSYKDESKDQLAKLYNDGILEDFRDRFAAGREYYHTIKVAQELLQRACEGRKNIRKPNKIRLAGLEDPVSEDKNLDTPRPEVDQRGLHGDPEARHNARSVGNTTHISYGGEVGETLVVSYGLEHHGVSPAVVLMAHNRAEDRYTYNVDGFWELTAYPSQREAYIRLSETAPPAPPQFPVPVFYWRDRNAEPEIDDIENDDDDDDDDGDSDEGDGEDTDSGESLQGRDSALADFMNAQAWAPERIFPGANPTAPFAHIQRWMDDQTLSSIVHYGPVTGNNTNG